MGSVLQRFVDMLRLRARPQDLPASDAVLLGSLVAVVVASMLAIRPLYPPDLALARIGIDLLLQVGFVVAALRLIGHPERFRQTFAALCGTGALLVLVTWPLLDIVVDRQGRPGGDTLLGLAVIALLGVYAWSVVVVGHILRHALEMAAWRGILLALAYVLVSSLIGDTLVPAPGLELGSA